MNTWTRLREAAAEKERKEREEREQLARMEQERAEREERERLEKEAKERRDRERAAAKLQKATRGMRGKSFFFSCKYTFSLYFISLVSFYFSLSLVRSFPGARTS